MRDSEDQEKLKKYPKTTIRVRMPDHTIVQAVFQSKERGNHDILGEIEGLLNWWVW